MIGAELTHSMLGEPFTGSRGKKISLMDIKRRYPVENRTTTCDSHQNSQREQISYLQNGTRRLNIDIHFFSIAKLSNNLSYESHQNVIFYGFI